MSKIKEAVEAKTAARAALVRRLGELESERQSAIAARREAFREAVSAAGLAEDFDAMLADVQRLHAAAHRAGDAIKAEIAKANDVIKTLSEIDVDPSPPVLVPDIEPAEGSDTPPD